MRWVPATQVRRIFCGESQLISMEAMTPLGNCSQMKATSFLSRCTQARPKDVPCDGVSPSQ